MSHNHAGTGRGGRRRSRPGPFLLAVASLLAAALAASLLAAAPVDGPGGQASAGASGALEACLSGSALLSAGQPDLAQNYQDRLDFAIILCFQASYERPDDPLVWKRLGLLSETKSFFVSDPKERADLMAEAATHFGHSARLDYERSSLGPGQAGEDPPPLGLSDPYLAELVWLGRLRRGEVTVEELSRRHSAENLQASHRPAFWEERALMLLAAPPAQREEGLSLARGDFQELWATMPVEIPWRGLTDKFGPQRLKKIEALEAWAAGLVALAGQEADRDAGRALFLEALDLYRLALGLPLDVFELRALVGQLDLADAPAPDGDSLLALWALKDTFSQELIKRFPGEVGTWSAWGREFYSRAARQPDYRVWLGFFQEAGRKFQAFVDNSPAKAEALAEWGALLESKTYPDLAYLNLEDRDDRLRRTVAVLGLASEKYRQALALEPDRQAFTKSLSRILLRLSTFLPDGEAGPLEDESGRLSLLAISRDPDTAGAWLERGLDCLDFLGLGEPGPEARDRLTAEAFAAFRRYLLSNSANSGDLRLMADRVWRASEDLPGLRPQGLALLSGICRRLILLEPGEPDHRFALGLSLYSVLAESPSWPDDLVFSGSLYARSEFDRALACFEEGLLLLSDLARAAPRAPLPGPGEGPAPLDRPWGWPAPEARGFLSAEPGPGETLASASFQERFGTAAKRELGRLVAVARPELLPPWYQFRLAAMLRRLAAWGYPPPIDQMAFFRLSDAFLTRALEGLAAAPEDLPGAAGPRVGPSLRSLILAEKGLVLAEMGLLAEEDSAFLLEAAGRAWAQAEADSPSSSRYARARWAAWTATPEALAPLLAHTAEEQASLLWPSLAEARLEPAFRDHFDGHWFKAAWFGYGR
ncbi:MAG: hypothetical protein LBL95_01435 [Deltaproteobacteria bacterium]|nr:hypothetical protein [Deltaproteobacteria bacterium]